jgi:hypothetical protein
MSLSDSVIDQLPLPGQRWVMSRKVAVIEAVRAGRLPLEEACQRYELCLDEFNSWAAAVQKHGAPGLRVTRFQIYRENPRRPSAAPGLGERIAASSSADGAEAPVGLLINA